jgi:hypothetical protein
MQTATNNNTITTMYRMDIMSLNRYAESVRITTDDSCSFIKNRKNRMTWNTLLSKQINKIVSSTDQFNS